MSNPSPIQEKELLDTLPPSIRSRLAHQSYVVDDIGRSGSTVLTFEDTVLKIEAFTPETELTVQVMEWMAQRLPAPRILDFVVSDDKSYLLMSRIPGKMSCDEVFLENPEPMVKLLAEGLKMLWRTDITGCPRERTILDDLARARQKVSEGRVDPEVFAAEADGFDSPESLLAWLETHVPEYDPVVCHGDYCMPNILLENGAVSGFIDLAHAGISDRCSDIYDCFWSLTANFNGTFGGKVYEDFDPRSLFPHLGIDIDEDKLKFYQLLGALLA